MKISIYLICFLLIIGSSCTKTPKTISDSNICTKTQETISDNAIEKRIKDFYTEYCYAWENPSVTPNQLGIKLDSLVALYCTNELKIKASKWYEDGHDLFTSDWGIRLNSLNTLTIARDTIKPNNYNVSYDVESFPVSPTDSVMQKVTLVVTIVSGKDSCTICGVKDISKRIVN